MEKWFIEGMKYEIMGYFPERKVVSENDKTLESH